MQKFVPVTLAAVLASTILIMAGCAFPGVYKIDVQQGNIITQDMIEQLKPGMTRRQVQYVLGNPVVENTFDPSLDSYVYTIQRAGGDIKQQVIKVHYKDDAMTHYTGTILPSEDTGLTPRLRREQPLFDETPAIPK